MHLRRRRDLRSRPVRRLQLHDRARARAAASATCGRDGKPVKILCVGRKGRDQLRRDFGRLIVGTIDDIGQAAADVRRRATRRRAHRSRMFEAGEFDVCTLIYNRFKSAMTQIVTAQQLIPFARRRRAAEDWRYRRRGLRVSSRTRRRSWPSCCRTTWRCRSSARCSRTRASEQGARMTAMDNATRNAGDMINRLTLNYNRTRQAAHHQGADRDHLRRRGASRRPRRRTRGALPWPRTSSARSPRCWAPSSTCSSTASCRRS